MMRTTRDGIGGTPRRALAATLLAGAVALAGFGAWIGPARAADESAAAGGIDAGSAAAEQRIPSLAAATRLLGIEAERTQGGTLLRLRADGEIANAKTVVLENPTRLVLDLPGLKSAMAARGVDVGTDQAARVRIGQHDDKLRIVVDGGPTARPFEGHALMPRQDGLWVGLGSEAAAIMKTSSSMAAEAAPVAAVSAAPAPVSAAAEPASETPRLEEMLPLGNAAPVTIASERPETLAPAGSVRVHGVQYDTQPDRDRLVIVQEGTAPHSILRPDAETLIVSLQNAVLDPGATIRVTPQEPGPISLVTAIQMPNATTPEVRVAIAHAPGAEPTVTQEGEFLVLDFPRPSNLEAALGQTPDPDRVERIAHSAAAATSTAAPAKSPPTHAPAAADSGSGAASDLLKEGGLIGGKTYTGRRLSLDFKDVEISDVLRLIADVSDLNVIAGDEVKGQVTIRLTDVPWDQALDVMLLTKGLGFVHVGNVLRIAPQQVLKAEEAARLEDRRAKEKLEDLIVKIHPMNYAKAEAVEPIMKKLLTSRGSVQIDKRTNSMILKDIPGVIAEAVALAKAVDTPTPQVLIETKLVEATLDFSREIGAVWGIGSNPDVTGSTTNPPPPNQTAPGTSFPFQQPNNVVVSNPITSSANGLMNLGGYILNDRFNLTLQLQAAESNGEGKVISSPRVVTLDNIEAKIEQGLSIPYQTFENGDAQLTFIDALLSLKVTPHITNDQRISMAIQVTKNFPDFSVPTLGGAPAIAKNEVKTDTLVKDGQTLVLGGIYVIDRSEKSDRVPFLYRIPILGNAFKNDTIRDKRRELLIFVTPRIVQTETAQN
jgi:type IV pilus assembly protein PilQ